MIYDESQILGVLCCVEGYRCTKIKECANLEG